MELLYRMHGERSYAVYWDIGEAVGQVICCARRENVSVGVPTSAG